MGTYYVLKNHRSLRKKILFQMQMGANLKAFFEAFQNGKGLKTLGELVFIRTIIANIRQVNNRKRTEWQRKKQGFIN